MSETSGSSQSSADKGGVLIFRTSEPEPHVYYIPHAELQKFELTNKSETNLDEAIQVLDQASPEDSNVFAACGDFLMAKSPCCWLKIDKLQEIIGCE